MYLKNARLGFVQIPNIFVSNVVTTLSEKGEEGEDFQIASAHPERMCGQIGFLASRKMKMFTIVQNTYERLVYLFLEQYNFDPERKWHNFGEFIRSVYDGQRSDTVTQLWYIHNIENGDVDNTSYRSIEIDEVAVDNVFLTTNELSTYLSDVFGNKVVVEDVTMKGRHYSQYYTWETQAMVEEMYGAEIEHFGFKFDNK